METKHTKGKWIAKKHSSKTRTEIWVDGDIQPTFIVIHNETTSRESQANIKLIESAPELLEALISFTDGKERDLNTLISNANELINKITK